MNAEHRGSRDVMSIHLRVTCCLEKNRSTWRYNLIQSLCTIYHIKRRSTTLFHVSRLLSPVASLFDITQWTNTDFMKLILNVLIISLVAFSCGGNNTESNVKTPGNDKSGESKLLNAGADLLQGKIPIQSFNVYLDGFHFYNGNIKAQMEAHHYVSQLNEDIHQAIIFDGNDKSAKLMGVEYIISEKLFKTLDEEEKKLWHSHHYEVMSGTLIAPGIPDAAEHELMEKLVSTYGKTIHTWHTDQERILPVGSPMIMMGFTKDGQLDKQLLNDRDKRFDISTSSIKNKRSDISKPNIDPAANAWEKGNRNIRQFIITDQVDSAIAKHLKHNLKD